MPQQPFQSPLPDQGLWQQVQQAAVASQQLVSGSVAVGGTAAALYAGHRLSLDTDHLLPDLKQRFDAVREQLETSDRWKTARVQPPVLILGAVDGVEIGYRQMRRSLPIETERLDAYGGSLVVPTLDELVGMKAYLAYSRRATRDFLDFAALASLMGDEPALAALMRSDERYGELQTNSAALEIAKTLADPRPYDLDTIDLSAYKGIQPPWNNWQQVAATCERFGKSLGQRLMQRDPL